MINLIENRKIPFTISGIVFIASVIVIAIYGFKPGIDFTGGSLLEVKFASTEPTVVEVQKSLEGLDLGNVQVQLSDDQKVIMRMRFLSEVEHQNVLLRLRESFAETAGAKPAVIEERFETIGPTISARLRDRSIKAAVAVVLAIVLYIAYAFRKVSKPVKSWKYGLTAIIALIHDVTITMAVFSLMGAFKGVEIDIPFVVALLTIMGYSVNDTIVVFDRIRENLIKRGSDKFAETVNLGVNQTFTRSINTSITTLLVLVALFLFGGDSVHYFTLTLIIGVLIGTYSSIFLATPLLVEWEKRK